MFDLMCCLLQRVTQTTLFVFKCLHFCRIGYPFVVKFLPRLSSMVDVGLFLPSLPFWSFKQDYMLPARPFVLLLFIETFVDNIKDLKDVMT